jgi:hypothetical protein
MFKFIVFALAITYVNAGNLLRGLSGGYGGGLALSGGYGPALRSGPIGPVTAAVQSTRSYEVRPVALYQEPAIPQLIEVEPSEQPIHFVFRSQSSPVFVQQVHTPSGPGQYEATRSEDAPHHLVHEVYKPIIQELREVIQPFRKVIQEVKPVLEEVHTVVAKGEPRLRAAIAPIPVAAPYAAPALRAAPVFRSAPLLAAKAY